MQLLVFIILFPVLWCISILPFRVLYILSDILYIFTYYIIGYRKKTVKENLIIALPDLSEQERNIIKKKFYRHFCDILLEVLKTMTISDKELKKRFVFDNIELVLDMEAKGKSIVLICAHYSSYEWLSSISKHISFPGFGIYKRIRNKYFDKLVQKIRRRLGSSLLNSKETIQKIKENQANGLLGFYGFISDQSPKLRDTNYYTRFFDLEVPAFTSAEYLAKKLDMNVVFVKEQKIKRGYYKASIIPLEGEPKDYPDYQITDTFFRLLEQQILEAPEYYLWTHKRWKHRKNKPV